jgi:peptide/nickel transport system permease protein
MEKDYIRTARAKGLREKTVVLRHGLRNAMIPLVTVIGLDIGTAFGGAIITETIFAWPGLGQLLIKAVQSRDFPLVQAIVVVIATMFISINLVVDILYTYLDPRVRF